MKPEVKAKWVAALRSGNYKQGSGRLYDGNGYCCLGVLCDVYAKENDQRWIPDGENFTHSFLGKAFALPTPVAEWAGLPVDKNDSTGNDVRLEEDIDIGSGAQTKSLIEMNDGVWANDRDYNLTFDQIARVIEEKL